MRSADTKSTDDLERSLKEKVGFRASDLDILKLFQKGMRRRSQGCQLRLVLGSKNFRVFLKRNPAQELFADLDCFSHVVLFCECIDLDNDSEESQFYFQSRQSFQSNGGV